MREEAARHIAHYPRYFWMKKDKPVTSRLFSLCNETPVQKEGEGSNLWGGGVIAIDLFSKSESRI